MKINAILLKGPKHVRRQKAKGRAIISSDTVFSAICCSLKRLEVDVEEFMEKFEGESCKIGSMFPRVSDELYFPTPMHFSQIAWKAVLKEGGDLRESYRKLKKIKKGKYVKMEILEKMLRGEEVSLKELEEAVSDFAISQEIARSSLDRVTEKSSLYYLAEEFMPQEVDAWIPYLGPKEVLEEFVIPSLRELGEQGIGGKATWGMGHFEVKGVKELEIRGPEGVEYAMSLSLALVTADSRKNAMFWDLVEKGGWKYPFDGRTFRKPVYTFFSEGSIFKGEFEGSIAVVKRGDEEVKVYGKAFLIPCSLPRWLLDAL